MSTYPHVRDSRSTPAISFCACGASATGGPASWGDDCPRLMREILTNTAADLSALRIEHAAWGALLDATRADRDAARSQVAGYREVHGRIRDLLGGDADIAVENLARAVVADRDAARAEVATLRAEVTADKVRTDAIETERMWSVSAFHRTRQERDEARDEVTALRAQVADLQRLGVSIHKAADAARKAERADVVAFLGKQAGSFHATNEIDACATLAGAKMAIQHGAHEGAAGGS